MQLTSRRRSEQTNTVTIPPSSGPDLAEVADHIGRLSDAWANLYRAIASTRDAVDERIERAEWQWGTAD